MGGSTPDPDKDAGADEEKFERLLVGREEESEIERDIRHAALRKLNKKLGKDE